MKDCERLTEMGIQNPAEIDKFLVNSIANYDVLRIVYRRRKGSLLPASRIYKFPRIPKTVTEGGETKTVMTTDPVLRSAVEELERCMKSRESTQTIAETILEEIELLEEDIALRAGYIKELARLI